MDTISPNKIRKRTLNRPYVSDDGSQDIATKLGIEVREFGKPGVLDDEVYRSLKNNCWKEERGKSDYVIVCDADDSNPLDEKKPTTASTSLDDNEVPF